jgi:hypothetical protein
MGAVIGILAINDIGNNIILLIMLLVVGMMMALKRSLIPLQNNGAFFICNFVSLIDGCDVVRHIYQSPSPSIMPRPPFRETG